MTRPLSRNSPQSITYIDTLKRKSYEKVCTHTCRHLYYSRILQCDCIDGPDPLLRVHHNPFHGYYDGNPFVRHDYRSNPLKRYCHDTLDRILFHGNPFVRQPERNPFDRLLFDGHPFDR